LNWVWILRSTSVVWQLILKIAMKYMLPFPVLYIATAGTEDYTKHQIVEKHEIRFFMPMKKLAVLKCLSILKIPTFFMQACGNFAELLIHFLQVERQVPF